MAITPHDWEAALLAGIWLMIRLGERVLGKSTRSVDEDRVVELEKRYERIEAYIDKLKGSGSPRHDIIRIVDRHETWLSRLDQSNEDR